MSYFPTPAFDSQLLNRGNTQSPYSSTTETNHDEFLCPSIFNPDGTRKKIAQKEAELLHWLQNVIAEGNAYIRQSRAYENLDSAIDIITGKVSEDMNLPENLSKVSINTIKRNLWEMAAILSNIRPSWLYESNSTTDQDWLHQAAIQNGLSNAWFERSFLDRTLKQMLQWALTEGTSYLSTVWNPHLYGLGEGGIEVKVYRYDKVLPYQIGTDFNLQTAYAVTLVEEFPLNRAKKIFWNKRHLILPDRGEGEMSRGILAGALHKVKTFAESIASADRPSKKTIFPVVDIFYTYVDDFSVNPSSQDIPMGNSSWAYTVPYIGKEIVDHNTNITRRATLEDCYLYPNRRLIIWCRNAILYDDASYWWHGKVPAVKYAPDSWVWDYLGYSLASEVISLQRSSVKMRRDIEDALRLSIDPPTMVDQIGVSKNVAENKSLRMPGKRIRGKLAMGEFIKPILPPENYKVGAEHFTFVKETEDKIAFILGLPDLKSLQQARQVPSSDSIERFFAQAGAIVTDMSRSMDPLMWEIADMNRYYFFQFYDLPMRIKLLGKKGVSAQDFDYVPGTLIPSNLPFESPNAIQSTPMQRAKFHIKRFNTKITATSLHQITNMQRQLMAIQASNVNPFLISPETLAKTLDIANWGELEGDTELDKVLAFMEIQKKLGLKATLDQSLLQLLIMQLAQSQSPEGQLANAMAGITQKVSEAGDLLRGGNSAGGGGNGSGESGSSGEGSPSGRVGHPPTFNKAPKLVQKDGGTRSTLTTS